MWPESGIWPDFAGFDRQLQLAKILSHLQMIFITILCYVSLPLRYVLGHHLCSTCCVVTFILLLYIYSNNILIFVVIFSFQKQAKLDQEAVDKAKKDEACYLLNVILHSQLCLDYACVSHYNRWPKYREAGLNWKSTHFVCVTFDLQHHPPKLLSIWLVHLLINSFSLGVCCIAQNTQIWCFNVNLTVCDLTFS